MTEGGGGREGGEGRGGEKNGIGGRLGDGKVKKKK